VPHYQDQPWMDPRPNTKHISPEKHVKMTNKAINYTEQDWCYHMGR